MKLLPVTGATPRGSRRNFQRNLDLVKKVEEVAQGEDIVPIPGTNRVKYLDENLGALQVRLTPEELRQIDAVFPAGAASGERYPPQSMQAIDK